MKSKLSVFFFLFLEAYFRVITLYLFLLVSLFMLNDTCGVYNIFSVHSYLSSDWIMKCELTCQMIIEGLVDKLFSRLFVHVGGEYRAYALWEHWEKEN